MTDQKPRESEPPPPQAASSAKTVTSRELFDGSEMVLIRHEDSVYRLMKTRSGKLILQK